MQAQTLKKIDFAIAIWGALLCLGSLVIWDTEVFLGVFLGALLATVNWIAFRFLMTRLFLNKARKRFQYGIILATKTMAVFSAITLVVFFVPVNKIAFLVGISSLILGIFTYSFIAVLSSKAALEKDC